jgi:thioredoxin reductase
MPTHEALIIGAGPFGLSISAHLRSLGVEHRVVGRPMDTWRSNMPAGMNMRSEPYGSDMAAPQAGYDVATYCRNHGLDYVDRLGPLSMERFLEYADWFAQQLVPDLDDLTVTNIAVIDGGFRVSFADAEAVTSRCVVVATGVLPYANIPSELSGLSPDLVTHTTQHHRLHPFRGHSVAVVGSGQSALETAALLHEIGADAQLVMRRPAINWLEPNPKTLSRIGHVRRPVNKLCEGWHCAVWNSPAIFGRLPRELRIAKARTVLGPAGAWWLKDRIEGVVDVRSATHLRGAVSVGSGVRLLLDSPERTTIDVDHIIAGTGFRVDVARLPFLPEGLRARISTLNGYPTVTRAGESSVPGLYFAGVPAAVSLGPSVRFIAGTHTSVRHLARSLARISPVSDRHAQASKPSTWISDMGPQVATQEVG